MDISKKNNGGYDRIGEAGAGSGGKMKKAQIEFLLRLFNNNRRIWTSYLNKWETKSKKN
jgi:hypothetical protein